MTSRTQTVRALAWRRRGDMVLRILAAVPLGYAVAGLWATALSRLLPGDLAQATIAATLVSLALCAFAAMWAFAARSGWRAVYVLALLGLVAGGAAWLSGRMNPGVGAGTAAATLAHAGKGRS